jgi:hypothetical protein
LARRHARGWTSALRVGAKMPGMGAQTQPAVANAAAAGAGNRPTSFGATDSMTSTCRLHFLGVEMSRIDDLDAKARPMHS